MHVELTSCLSFSNYTLKFVDASFYQVARGLVLPFTVCTSYLLLNTRPSLRILFSCSIVTAGFFIGVFLDGTNVSRIGIFFGVTSSALTALHSVVIKKSLNVVNGSALLLSWYTNAVSAIVLAPIVILAGEGPAIAKLFLGVDELVREPGSMSALKTFLWGTAITVSALMSIVVRSPNATSSGHYWVYDEHSQPFVNQSHLTNYSHDFICCARSCCVASWNVAVP